MKLPSGREIPNTVLADIIDFWVLDTMQTESLGDGESAVGDMLAEEGWDEEEKYTEEDTIAILEEIRPTVVSFYNELWDAYGKLYEEYVHGKYPHED